MKTKQGNYLQQLEKLGWERERILKEMEKINGAEDNLSAENVAKFDQLKAEFDQVEREASQVSEMQKYREKLAEAALYDEENAEEVDPAAPDPNYPNGKFKSLGEQLVAVAMAADPSRTPDRRLLKGAAAGMSEGVNADGGFMVQTDLVPGLTTPIFDGGQIASRVRRIPVSSMANALKMNLINQTSRAAGSRWGAILAYWLSEAGTKTASMPKWRQVSLNLKKLIGLSYATDELLQDAAALEAVLTEAFRQEFTFMVEDSFYRGTGAGQPLGILAAPCLVTVAKEVGQAATTLVAANVEKMYARMPASSLTNAVWHVNQDCWPQIFQFNHAVGNGGAPMFIPAGQIASAPAGTLLGRPIIPVEYACTLGTVGDIAFCDWSQYIAIDKGGTQQDSSIHVRFIYDETTFRFVYRVDGQPIPAAALTPYQGTNTQSPFVVLATRS